MAQADIGERRHRHHSDAALGRMAAEVLAAAVSRREVPTAERLVQFTRSDGGFSTHTSEVAVRHLPPVASLASERAS
jgi:glucosyl-3-phosphoglycerate synthase